LIVVDASLFLVWLLNEPRHGLEDAVFDLLAVDTILAPAHWPNEVANGLRKAVRTKRLAAREIAPIARHIDAFDIGLADPMPVREVGNVAAEALRHDLSAYDMAYIRLARDRRCPLATVDAGMRRAATALGIRILPE
jgi:predicted nucleic acid-binding protein